MRRPARTASILATAAGLVLVVAAAVATLAVVSDDGASMAAASGPSQRSGPGGPSGDGGSQPVPTQDCPGPWGCAQLERFGAASALVAGVTGVIGIVVRDRQTGAQWHAGQDGARYWAGSTPKLALAVALREQARVGQITLDATANAQIAAMLSVSDNKAADALWDRYGDASGLMQRFRSTYGMSSAGYVSGFPRRWGFVKTTPQDLANLMAYILGSLNPADRAPIVAGMRTVGPVQRWGVWGAGPSLNPGVKNGWSQEIDEGNEHWITATVGFAGPDERYVVAAMYHQPAGGDSIDRGVHVLTDLVATVFGAPVPAPVTIPDDQ